MSKTETFVRSIYEYKQKLDNMSSMSTTTQEQKQQALNAAEAKLKTALKELIKEL